MAEYIKREDAIAYIREQSEECQKAFEELGGESGIYADAYNDLAEDFYSIPAADVVPVEVLSMYDGMSCGHIALDKLGAEITTYYATEIDKYAVQTTQHNFPDTVQLGDAFQVRDESWSIAQAMAEQWGGFIGGTQ